MLNVLEVDCLCTSIILLEYIQSSGISDLRGMRIFKAFAHFANPAPPTEDATILHCYQHYMHMTIVHE